MTTLAYSSITASCLVSAILNQENVMQKFASCILINLCYFFCSFESTSMTRIGKGVILLLNVRTCSNWKLIWQSEQSLLCNFVLFILIKRKKWIKRKIKVPCLVTTPLVSQVFLSFVMYFFFYQSDLEKYVIVCFEYRSLIE